MFKVALRNNVYSLVSSAVVAIHACIIRTILCEWGRPVNDPFDTTSSTTRSKLCGFASALLLISLISRHWELRYKCTFCWVTDSKAALRQVILMVRRGPPIGHLPQDSDLLTLICSSMREIRQIITMKWIEGHQEDRNTCHKSLKTNAHLKCLLTLLPQIRYSKEHWGRQRGSNTHCLNE
jgi:hypothetical protein